MKDHPYVTIAIVNWNGGEEVLNCLSSLQTLRYPAFRIIVADNGSQDGSVEKIRHHFPEITLLENSDNEGYTRANNRIMRHALEEGADYILLLNNDTLAEPSMLERLMGEARKRKGASLLGPRICCHPERNRTWAVGGRIVFGPNLLELIGYHQEDKYTDASPFEVDFLPGCALLIPKQVLEQIGFLDEDFFAYIEDVDFCFRARNAGFPCIAVPEALLYHSASQSTGGGYSQGRKYLQALHLVHFLQKSGASWKNWFALILFDILCLPFAFILETFRGSNGAVVAKALGIWDGLRGRRIRRWLSPGEPFSRKKIELY